MALVIEVNEVLMEYNKYMNGVDKYDQYLNSYPFNRKTINKWKKVVVKLIDLAVTNTMAIYSDHNPALKPRYQSRKKGFQNWFSRLIIFSLSF